MTTSPAAARLPLSIAIPTYRREAVLIDTLHHLLALAPRAAEILVLDQTTDHETATVQALEALHNSGDIRWIRLATPSIPAAMNQGLLLSREPLVVFVDDDVIPEGALLTGHLQAHADHPQGVIVAGRVIQPWEEGVTIRPGEPGFASFEARWMTEFIGCNFSVPRALAIELGGFDENFVKVAYRFEAEFAHRFRQRGKDVFFAPGACLHHLKVTAGGTRTFGEHLSTWRPDHAVGAYYYGLRTGGWLVFIKRPLRSVATRYHLRHPWRIFSTLVAELRGMFWALRLFGRGPRRLDGAVTEEVR